MRLDLTDGRASLLQGSSGRLYFFQAHVASQATQYQLLICRVLCGRVRAMGQPIDREMTRLRLPSTEFDSIEGGPHCPKRAGPGPSASLMYVVYEASQVYPDFIVTYRHEKSR